MSNNLPFNRRRGFTLVEVLVSLAIFVGVSAVIALSAWYMARFVSAVAGQQRIENWSRRFMTELITDATDATNLSVTAPVGVNQDTRLVIIKPNTQVIYRYRNVDGNVDTIEDNVIDRAEVPVGTAVTEADFDVQLRLLSIPLGFTQPVFRVDPRSNNVAGVSRQPLINVFVRVGDREPGAGSVRRRADDLVTGRGYQSFLIDLWVTRGDRGF